MNARYLTSLLSKAFAAIYTQYLINKKGSGLIIALVYLMQAFTCSGRAGGNNTSTPRIVVFAVCSILLLAKQWQIGNLDPRTISTLSARFYV